MKEDILEQIVEDYLHSRGYFTRHNLKFRPDRSHPQFISNQDSNHSDVDVIGLHPTKIGVDRVWVVSCKSWQSGFDVKQKLEALAGNKVTSGRETWRLFRELVEPKWAQAFCQAVKAATGQSEFTYFTAVTRVKGDPLAWEYNPTFGQNLRGNPVRLISLQVMMQELSEGMTTTVVPSHLGRTVQLLKAAGAKLNWPGSGAAHGS